MRYGRQITEEALEFVHVLKRSDNDLRKKILKLKKDEPVDEMRPKPRRRQKQAPEEVSIVGSTLRWPRSRHPPVGCRRKGTNVSAVGIELIEEALASQGLLHEEGLGMLVRIDLRLNYGNCSSRLAPTEA